MAEKEERIFITTIERAEDIDEFCVYGRDCMTHSEAIERMAKAICAKKNCKDVCNNCEVWLHFKDCAEAALDALFGD